MGTQGKQILDLRLTGMERLHERYVLLRAANLSPQFREAAQRLERSIVELQEAYTLDEEGP